VIKPCDLQARGAQSYLRVGYQIGLTKSWTYPGNPAYSETQRAE
jgi:hypothetical protein